MDWSIFNPQNYENLEGEPNEESLKAKEMDIDDVLVEIGEFGRSQILQVFILCLLMVPTAYQVLSMTFIAVNPSWVCNNSSSECNNTEVFILNHKFYSKRCAMKRESWKFVRNRDFSIVTEWDLVCGKEYLAYIAFSSLQIGDVIGALVIGYAADKYGRKRVLYPTWLGLIVFSLSAAFANNVWIFTAIQLISGFFKGGVFVVLWVLINESLGPNYKNYSNLLWCAYTLSFCVMSLQAWLFQKWRTLEILLTAPYLILTFTYKFVPESIRWLHVKGRRNSAEKILFNISKFNRKQWPNVCLSPCSASSSEEYASFKHLFFPWKMFTSTLIQMIIWFIIGVVYNGLFLISDNISYNLYRDFAIVSIVDVPASMVVIYFCNKLGRKNTTLLSTLISGISIIAIGLIPLRKDISWIRVTLGVVGKFLLTLSFNAMYTWSAEIIPTKLRSKAIGVCSMANLLGAAASPWASQLLSYIQQDLPFFFLGSIVLFSSFLSYLLPETRKL